MAAAGGGDGGAGSGGETGASSGRAEKFDKKNPFHKDPGSYTIFSGITDSRYQKKIKAIASELHDYAEEHQTMLRQRLTYEELLQGMMYPGAPLLSDPSRVRSSLRSSPRAPTRVPDLLNPQEKTLSRCSHYWSKN